MGERNIVSFKESAEEMLASQDYEALRELLEELHPYEVATLLEELEEPEQLIILELMPTDMAAETLEHLEYEDQYRLLDHLEDTEAGKIIDAMPSDVIADLVMAIHPHQAQKILGMVPEEYLQKIEYLMTYPEDSAGGIMSLEYIAVRERWTVERVIEHFRKVGRKESIASYIYVVDNIGQLVGVVSLKELLLSHPKTPISEIMHTNVVAIPVDADQEEAAKLMSQYDLLVLPVVDSRGRLVGVITADDIMDVIEEESTEDIHKLGGSKPLDLPYMHSSLITLFSKRINWLIFLFAVQAVTSNILKHFQSVLSSVVALSFFIPLFTDTGGNSGTQASSLIIRSLALGEVTTKDATRILIKELQVSAMLGATMGIVGYFFAWAVAGSVEIAIAVAITLFVVLVVSSTIGAMLPIIGSKLGIDPAVFSAPLITTVVDIVALTLYFNIATLILGIK